MMVEIRRFSDHSGIARPRRVMRYVFIWCSHGKVSVMVDGKELLLKKNDVLTITSGQVHYFKSRSGADGFILEFTLDFFCNTDNDIELIFHNGLFCHFDMNEVIPVQNGKLIESILNLIQRELANKPYQYLISVHSRIELLLIEVNRAKLARGDEIWKPEALFLKFLEMVRAHFHNNYSLSQYAEKLNTTVAKLNEQAKIHAGKTAQNVIYGLIISEAKRLLTYEDLSVKEVAYQLGFNDPFYFSNFFKKHTGISPKSYQRSFVL